MSKFEYRFDIAAILLASVLTVLGIAQAQAGQTAGADTAQAAGDLAGGYTGMQAYVGISGEFFESGHDFVGSRRNDRVRGSGEHGTVLAACWPPPEANGHPWHCRVW